VAVYQDFPSITGLSLVWFSKNINDSNNNTFTWDIPWALNWGTTPAPLVPGVMWSSGGTPVEVYPNTTGGINEMTVSYSNGDFISKDPLNNPDIPLGSMEAITDTSFTVQQAANMSIAVYMNGLPTFAMQGRPNGKYLFDTHPTYYVCVTDHKVGVAVTGSFVSSPTKVVFAGGSTSLEYNLDGTLTFNPVNS
jgi:hypothetical protein